MRCMNLAVLEEASGKARSLAIDLRELAERKAVRVGGHARHVLMLAERAEGLAMTLTSLSVDPTRAEVDAVTELGRGLTRRTFLFGLGAAVGASGDVATGALKRIGAAIVEESGGVDLIGRIVGTAEDLNANLDQLESGQDLLASLNLPGGMVQPEDLTLDGHHPTEVAAISSDTLLLRPVTVKVWGAVVQFSTPVIAGKAERLSGDGYQLDVENKSQSTLWVTVSG